MIIITNIIQMLQQTKYNKWLVRTETSFVVHCCCYCLCFKKRLTKCLMDRRNGIRFISFSIAFFFLHTCYVCNMFNNFSNYL